MSNIVLDVNGVEYEGWLEVEVEITLEKMSGSFTVSVSDVWGGSNFLFQQAKERIKPGDSVTVTIDGEIVITGYVDKREIDFDATSHTVKISGRDKAGDLVDCSVIDAENGFVNQNVDDIANKLTQSFGVSVNNKTDLSPQLAKFNVEQGMSPFQAIQKLCAKREALCFSDGKGGLTIDRAGSENLGAALVEGVNILQAKASVDYSNRFSKTMSKGQYQSNDMTNNDDNAIAESEVEDENIERYRPKIRVTDGPSDIQECEKDAKWNANTSKGKSREFDITVVGWRSDAGLWTINKTVILHSPLLEVYEEELLLKEVRFRLSSDGEITELKLTEPDAYKSLSGKTIKKNKSTGKSAAGDGNPYLTG